MTNDKLAEQLNQLATLKETKRDLEDRTKEVNASIKLVEEDIISAMIDMAEDAGLDDVRDFSVCVSGRNYSVAIKPFYSIRADDRPRAFNALRELGLGDLIVERVDDRSLTKALVEIEDENGELPDGYEVLPVSKYNKMSISDRKAAR